MLFLKRFFLISLITLTNLYAGSVTPSPRQTMVISNHAVPDGAAGVFVNAQCYGTNNRGTTNPLSPESRIVMVLKSSDAPSKTLMLDFPSALVRPGGVTTGQDCGATLIPSGTNINTPNGIKTIESLLSTSASGGGEIVSALSIANLTKLNGRTSTVCKEFPLSFGTKFSVANISEYYAIQVFAQAVSPASYYGYNGIMDRGTKIDIKLNNVQGGYSDSNEFLSITSIFPGQDGFCGGFHSPLMFFFDESVPAFSAQSTLLRGKTLPTTWVEKEHPGFFLVNLKKPGSQIQAANLFGDTVDFKNGFEALKRLDSNRDNVLNKDDKEFKNLYLWRDTNANSKNDANEISTLKSKKIFSINLLYNEDYREEKLNAILKGKSSFSYVDESGTKTEGTIVDVYFSDKDISNK